MVPERGFSPDFHVVFTIFMSFLPPWLRPCRVMYLFICLFLGYLICYFHSFVLSDGNRFFIFITRGMLYYLSQRV